MKRKIQEVLSEKQKERVVPFEEFKHIISALDQLHPYRLYQLLVQVPSLSNALIKTKKEYPGLFANLLCSLTDTCLNLIFGFLMIEDILSVSQTTRLFYSSPFSICRERNRLRGIHRQSITIFYTPKVPFRSLPSQLVQQTMTSARSTLHLTVQNTEQEIHLPSIPGTMMC